MTIIQNAETESFHSQCKRLGKNQNGKTVKIFNLSQSKFILHNSSNKTKPLTNQHIKSAPQKALAATENLCQLLLMCQLPCLPSKMHCCKEFLIRQIIFLQRSTVLPDNFVTCWALLPVSENTKAPHSFVFRQVSSSKLRHYKMEWM